MGPVDGEGWNYESWSLAIFTLSTFERRISNCKHYLPLEDGNMIFFPFTYMFLYFMSCLQGMKIIFFFPRSSIAFFFQMSLLF